MPSPLKKFNRPASVPMGIHLSICAGGYIQRMPQRKAPLSDVISVKYAPLEHTAVLPTDSSLSGQGIKQRENQDAQTPHAHNTSPWDRVDLVGFE